MLVSLLALAFAQDSVEPSPPADETDATEGDATEAGEGDEATDEGENAGDDATEGDGTEGDATEGDATEGDATDDGTDESGKPDPEPEMEPAAKPEPEVKPAPKPAPKAEPDNEPTVPPDDVPEPLAVPDDMPPPPKSIAKLRQMLDNPVMRPWGQLQVFTTLWDQDTDVQADPATYGDTEADPGFQLARARFGFFGELPHGSSKLFTVDYGLSMGINTPFDALQIGNSGVSMVDGFLRVNMDNKVGRGRIALGLVKVPFSRELLMSSQDLVFQERAVGPGNLTNVRDVGVLGEQSFVFGDSDDAPTVVVSGGAFNGNNDPLGDFDPGLMYGGRLEFHKGDTYRTWDPDGGIAIGAGVSGLINRELATSTSAFNADGFLRLGPWNLVGEIGRAVIRPTDVTVGAPTVLEDTTRLSWSAQTSVFIGFKDEQGVEVAVRASSFDDNLRLKDNGDVLILHMGAIWRSILPQLDLGAGYIHREELGGVNLPNDTIRIWTQIRPRRSKRQDLTR